MTKVAIVTGAARGIGAAITARLADEGWFVAAADVDPVPAAVGAPHIRQFRCDVSCEADISSLVSQVETEQGRIDAIVSNAGFGVNRPLQQLTLDDWNRVLATNLTASFLLARAAEAALRASKGTMVLIASTRAHQSEPNTLPYTASKGGLVALTHGLAMTLAPDVRVNCIAPGWIDTGRHGALSAKDHAQHPVGRVGRPEDIAAAVSFLLSEGAGFMTGAELIIDGGMTRKMIYV